MRIAAFTDEINRQDPQRAIELATAWRIEAVEIRTLPGGRFPRASDDEMRRLGQWIEGAGLSVSGVSPGLFKEAVDDPSIEPGIAELLPRACEWARRWGTDRVSIFGFRRGGGGPPAAVVDALGRMVDTARAAGCRLVLENEAVCWGDTGTEAAALIRQVPGLRLCWDPGNAARAGSSSPFPAEYDGLRDLVEHVHLKNYDPGENRWSVLDEGPVDWAGQLRALRRDGYAGDLVIETHTQVLPAGVDDPGELTPLEYNALHNLRCLRKLLA